MKKINIAIDGVAGSGKSSVAKKVAENLGYYYLDTGSMYRCVAYLLIKNNVSPKDEEAIKKVIENFEYRFENFKVFINGEDVTLKIRTKEVNEMTPNIVHLPFVRSFLVAKQQELGKNKGVVMDGRDIGSVVLKDAELKIYLHADVKARADRRYKENLEKGIKSEYDDILKNLEKRDYVDIHVSKALVKVEDAVDIDSTNLGINEVIDCVMKLAKERIDHARQ